MVLVGVALGAGSAYLSSRPGGSTAKYYRATHVLVLDTAGNGQSSVFANLDQAALLVTTGDVPTRVGQKLGENGRQLAEQVLITPSASTNTLSITAAARDAQEAERLADTFADELTASIARRAQDRYSSSRDRVLKRLDSLRAQISDLDAQGAGAPGNQLLAAQRNGLVDEYRVTYQQFQSLADQGDPTAPFSTLEAAQAVPIGAAEYNARLSQGQAGENIVQPAGNGDNGSSALSSGSSDTTFKGPFSRGLLGGFLGLLGGVGLALVAERLDRRLRSRQEVEEAFALPVLAEVPVLTRAQQHDAEVLSFTSPLSRTAEAHRAVRSALIFHHLGDRATTAGGNGDGPVAGESESIRWAAKEPLVVLVTSSTSREGKTTTTANLAAVFAESGSSVLAVNCDFRRPTLHRLLGAPDEPRKVLQTSIPGVMLVSGVVTDLSTNPAQVIAAQRRVIDAAKERFDVVLLDSAPILTTNDAIEIIPSVDAVVVVSRADVTTSDSALRARDLLERVQAPLIGVVLVADDSTPADTYYYYSSRSVGRNAGRREAVEPGPTDEVYDEAIFVDDEAASPTSA